MTTTNTKLGIVDRIRTARTEKELKALVDKMQTFEYMSPVTRRRALRKATLQLAHIRAKKEVA